MAKRRIQTKDIQIHDGPSLMELMLAMFNPSIFDYDTAEPVYRKVRFHICRIGLSYMDVYVHGITDSTGPGERDRRQHLIVECSVCDYDTPREFGEPSLWSKPYTEFLADYDAHRRKGIIRLKEVPEQNRDTSRKK